MRDLQSVNAKQRVGGVDAERSAPHISGVRRPCSDLLNAGALCRWMIEMFLPLLGTILMRVMSLIPPALVGAAGDRTSGSIWPVVERSILDEILAHRTTLVFVNSRGVAEKLTARLNDLYAQTRHGTNPDTVRDPGSEGREGFSTHYDAVVGSTTMLCSVSHEGDDVIAMAHHQVGFQRSPQND